MLEGIFELAGETAVVIGGGSGIGRGIALGLGAAGMRVVVADIDLTSARAIADQVTASGAAIGAHSIQRVATRSPHWPHERRPSFNSFTCS